MAESTSDGPGAFWQQYLAGAPMALLPHDFPRPPISSFVRETATRELDEALGDALARLAQERHSHLFGVALAGLTLLLARYGNPSEHVLGTLVPIESSGSPDPEVNPIAVKTGVAGDPDGETLLQQVDEALTVVAPHVGAPLDVMASTSPKQNNGESGFNIMLLPIGLDSGLSKMVLERDHLFDAGEHLSRCDVVFMLTGEDKQLLLECDFDAELLSASTVDRLLDHLTTLLKGLAYETGSAVSALQMLSADEQRQQLFGWNDTATAYPPLATLQQLFEEQVARSPTAAALTMGETTWSYAELNARANRLARVLRDAGVGPETLVGVLMDRSMEMVLALYAIIKAGGAYVPLDPEYPAERLRAMMEDAHTPVLLTRSALPDDLGELPARVICLDGEAQQAVDLKEANVERNATATDAAYVIFTSGSTGRPKGVLIEHRSICNRLLWMQDRYDLTPGDVVLQKTPFSFDVSVWEFFWPLMTGARLVLADPGGHRDSAYLVDLIQREAVTTVHFVPSMLQLFVEQAGVEQCESLQRVICSGEALPFDLQQRFFERLPAQLHNLYGPTEAAIDVSYWECRPDQRSGPVPIGFPVANTQLYVLDARLRPVPDRVPGELFIGGAQLARGYVGRDDLTAERFVPDPFSDSSNDSSSDRSGAKLYRTGDLVRRLPDGAIDYIGRMDHQVKLRGFRIELGEIETVLRQHPEVRDCVVIVCGDSSADHRLAAYCVPADANAPERSELATHLRSKLPEYMVPAFISFLPELPLTANGKLDRRALPDPAPTRTDVNSPRIGSGDEVIETIASLWRDVLAIDAVGLDDNFFDLGGHSLLLAQVRRALEQAFDLQLSMTELFQYPTIRLMADCVRGAASAKPAVARRGAQRGAATSETTTDFAIVGMVCRLPGAEDTDTFWTNLRDAVESIDRLSDEDLRAAGITEDRLADPNYVKAGGLLPDTELFDAGFFGVSPGEAEVLDPQQRAFLESAWHALEDAGYRPGDDDLVAGVFAGAGMNTYMPAGAGHPRHRGAVHTFQVMISNEKDFLPTRVSYKLNLTGPAINVQTACSTSLVAVHTACQSLADGECNLALAGGVSIRVPQMEGYEFQDGMIASPDGHCRTFDARAQGTVFSSGVGIVVLKRLSDAIADGDSIRAVIRGSAINNDGALKIGYTAPSVAGQAEVIGAAQAIAGITPDTVSYIEAHGTGTALGDPIEIEALQRVFGAASDARQYCGIGALKSNIGHTDAAAGVAGLIKTVLALQHRQLPPSLHFEEPNPQIDFANSPFYVVDRLREWPESATPRRAGVSAFGIGGTNCHVVVEQAPPPAPRDVAPGIGGELFCFSARSATALADLAGRHLAHFTAHPDTDLGDACFTAALGRNHFEHRMAICVADVDELRETLSAVAAGGDAPGVSSAVANAGPGKVAFLFTGQGAQWAGMGRDLYERHAGFRATLDHCAAILAPELEQPLLEVMFKADSDLLDQTAYTQPALFALEYALAELWRSWGVEADVVLGHSVGEYVAACIAGVFSLEDGLRLIAARGRLMQALPPGGAMAAVSATEDVVAAALDPWRDRLSIAAVNAPDSVVLSGDEAALTEALAVLAESGHTAQRLTVSHAFHSPLMDPMLAAFREVAGSIDFHPPQRELISNVSGRLADDTVGTAAYWVEHVRAPVRFADGMTTLDGLGCGVHLELGPQATLSALGQRCLPDSSAGWLHSLRRGRPAWRELLGALGGYYVRGGEIAWAGVTAGRDLRRVPLATYPFQRQRYWVEPPATGAALPGGPGRGHPLLGRRLPMPMSSDVRFATRFTVGSPAYIEDHRIFGTLVVAGASHCALFLLGAITASGESSCVLEEIFFLEPFVLDEDQDRAAQLLIEPGEEGCHALHLLGEAGQNDGQWKRHATGKVRYGPLIPPGNGDVDLDALRARCSDGEMSGAAFYEKVWVQGDDAGIAFRWITHLWRGDGEAYCEARAPELADDPDDYELYPGIIEGCFQLLRFCREFETAELLANGGDLYAPYSIDEFRFYGKPTDLDLRCYARIRERPDDRSVTGDLQLFDSSGRLIADIVGFTVRPIPRQALLKQLRQTQTEWLYDLEWIEQPAAGETAAATVVCMLLHDDMGVASAVRQAAADRGLTLVEVAFGDAYEAGAGNEFTVDPSRPDDFERLWRTLNERGITIHHVIHASALRAVPAQAPSLPQLQLLQQRNLGALLHLVQATAGAALSHAPQINIVTNRCQRVAGHPLSEPHQAPVWGFARVLAQEHPEFACRCIDLDDAPLHQLQPLLDEVLSAADEDQVALRDGGKRHVARLRQVTDNGSDDTTAGVIRADATYWITGGLGGIGRSIAEHLVEAGARHLVLSSRRAPDVDAERAVAHLQEAGAQVTLLACDVAVREQAAATLDRIQTAMPPLAGIIHAAGVLDDGIVAQLDWGRFASVMEPKTAGAWNLHQLTSPMDLDFFVCFSSASALFGTMGQANYAAANEFLRALAVYRHDLGLPALSIDWGPWSQVGMAAQLAERDQQRARDQGWQSIDPPTGGAILASLLQRDRPVTAVLPIDWVRFADQWPGSQRPPLFRALKIDPGKRQAASPREAQQKRDVAAELKALPAARQRPALADFVSGQVASLLGHGAADGPIPSTQGFSEMGLDSLMGVELRSRLQAALGLSLSSTFALDYSNIDAATDFLAASLFEASPAPPGTSDTGLKAAPETGSEVDDGDLGASIEQELAALEAQLESSPDSSGRK